MRRIAIAPANRFRRLVVVPDVATNLAREVSDRGEDAPGEQIALDLRKPELDLIEPGRIGRREMQMHVRVVEEKGAHGLGLVRREVVGDHVTFDPLFDWTPNEKDHAECDVSAPRGRPASRSGMSIAQGIEELNNTNLAAQSAEVASRHTALRNHLRRLTWQTVLLGLAVALVVVFRLRYLERRSDEAEQHMRELSQQLVNTQEEERKSLSP